MLSTSNVGHSEVNSQSFFSKYLKGLSSSLLKTLEKKLHNASALLLSADATCAFPWLSTYFKSLIGSLLVVFDLAFFQKCLEFCLHAAAMSF